MKKRKMIFILIAAVIFSLAAVPGVRAVKRAVKESKAENDGELYVFRLKNLTYERGVGLTFSVDGISGSIFGKSSVFLGTDGDGFAVLTPCADVPEGKDYIRGKKNCLYFSFPVSQLPCGDFEKLIKVHFTDLEGQFSVDPDGYIDMCAGQASLEARICDGKVSPVSVYIGGEKAEDYLSSLNEKFDSFLERLTPSGE